MDLITLLHSETFKVSQYKATKLCSELHHDGHTTGIFAKTLLYLHPHEVHRL